MRLLSFCAFALALAASPAAAFDPAEMSAEERAAFREEVRSYLLDNPEVLMEALDVLETRQAAAQEEADRALVQANAERLFEDGVSWEGGNPDGDVTLVEFMDYRCGYCRRAFPEIEALLEADEDVRLVIKEFPILGEESVLASRFAIAARNVAGDAAYKKVHDALIQHSGAINEAALRRMARTLELEADAILAAMSDAAVTEELRANRALAQDLSINGTPSFVLGDTLLRGYVPLAQLQARIDETRQQ